MDNDFESNEELTLHNLVMKIANDFSSVDKRFNGVKNKFISVDKKIDDMDFKINYLMRIISEMELKKNIGNDSNTEKPTGKDLRRN